MPRDPMFHAGASAYDLVTGRWSEVFRATLLAAGQVSAGQTVLEASAGTGGLAQAAAAAVGPSGRVIATDIALPMLRVAQGKVTGLPVYPVAMDGQALACRDESADVVLCQLGLMFFPDPGRGLAEFRRVLRRRGRLAVQTWSVPERVHYLGMLAEALAPHYSDQRDALYAPTALADPARLRALLAGAGFGDVAVRLATREIAFDSFEQYWSGIEAGGGRLAQFYVLLPEAARRPVREEVARRMAGLVRGGRLLLSGEALIATGLRP